MTEMCKVVRGSGAMGFVDVTEPMTYAECIHYLRSHIDEVSMEVDEDVESLDIMNVEAGRLMSWVL